MGVPVRPTVQADSNTFTAENVFVDLFLTAEFRQALSDRSRYSESISMSLSEMPYEVIIKGCLSKPS